MIHKTSLIMLILISGAFAWPKQLPVEREAEKQKGSMLAEIAKELIHRSTSSTQILSLNLTNLLLLLVLKAVVYGAGYIGQPGYKGRELDEESVISESEVALALGYLLGDTCLYRAACEVPQKATEYLGAAEMILQTFKLLPRPRKVDESYEKMLSELRKAIEYGMKDQCPPQYTCKKENIANFLRRER